MTAQSIKGALIKEIAPALQQRMTCYINPTLAAVFIRVNQDQSALCKIITKEGINVPSRNTGRANLKVLPKHILQFMKRKKAATEDYALVISVSTNRVADKTEMNAAHVRRNIVCKVFRPFLQQSQSNRNSEPV